MRQTGTCLLTVSLFTVAMVAACGTNKQVAVEQLPAYQPTPQSTPVRMPVVLAPKSAEVQDAIKRVFHDAAVIDPNYKPNFLAGDFNGDTSQDIAVILKPAPGKLDEMNEELPRWLLRDPRANNNHRARLQIEKDEVLLAVIHGHGTNDWRDPEATQTFLLKNVVGNDFRVQSVKEFMTTNSGRKLPRAQGDLIGETFQGTQGYLYYSTQTYLWYDPKTFKGEPVQPLMVHRPRTAR
jgi:hypothetical protein